MELKLKEAKQIETEELIFEPKRLVALGRLYHSLVSQKIYKRRHTTQFSDMWGYRNGSFVRFGSSVHQVSRTNCPQPHLWQVTWTSQAKMIPRRRSRLVKLSHHVRNFRLISL